MQEEVGQYIASRRSEGFSDDRIKQSLLASGWSEKDIALHLAPVPKSASSASSSPKPSEAFVETKSTVEQLTKKHLNASQVLLFVGIALVVVAAIVVVFNSWSTLSPWGRFIFIALPNAVLFAISLFIKDKTELDHVKDGTAAAGLLMLPATAGVFLYQFGFYAKLDYLLFFWSALIGLPFFIYYDLKKKKNFAAIFVLIDVLSAVTFLGAYYGWELSTWQYVIFGEAVVTLMIGYFTHRYNDSLHKKLYEVVSAFLFLSSIPLIFADWLLPNDISTDILVVWGLLTGFALMTVGSLYGWLFKPASETEKALQRFLLVFAMFAVFLPLIMACGTGGTYLLTTIVVSTVLIVLGMMVGVALMFNAGIIGLVLGLIFFLFQQVDIDKVITLFVIGFVAIGLSIGLAKFKLFKRAIYSQTLAKSLGMIDDSQVFSDLSKPHRRMSPVLIILLIIFATVALSSLYSLLYSDSYDTITNPDSVDTLLPRSDIQFTVDKDELVAFTSSETSIANEIYRDPGMQVATRKLTAVLSIDSPEDLVYGVHCRLFEPTAIANRYRAVYAPTRYEAISNASIGDAADSFDYENRDATNLFVKKGKAEIRVAVLANLIKQPSTVYSDSSLESALLYGGVLAVNCRITGVGKSRPDGSVFSTIPTKTMIPLADNNYGYGEAEGYLSNNNLKRYDIESVFLTKNYSLANFLGQ